MDIKDKFSKTERIKSISYESQEENMKKWVRGRMFFRKFHSKHQNSKASID